MSQYIPTLDPIDSTSSRDERTVKKLTGMPLVATWAVLIAAPWVVIYQVVQFVL
ncbi:hypothetical protein [Azospirillum rugosum]|uniref:Carbohydrate ABC transporter permease n=1 Tax=Azospirillum rugosum TaxID=416170 RepID=A0ABS4SIR5_9PROT|nr:hypothetical protein [Azospirillum rugosum]MBP2292451.1 hypothetical protein [Azospirillum rugosum]MDQ0526210.1 hypothetical protein [Azospirillum rugosum]